MKGRSDDALTEFCGLVCTLVLLVFCVAVVCGMYHGLPHLLGDGLHPAW